ncbi:MAG: CPBP family intramembrane metalloprotease [Candidatus Omnitrophica bacterium]|jgi:hypothetical protein|nr:CPBP family intramembrane metalloprotease [Candidatus Omnitrophota bacterium]
MPRKKKTLLSWLFLGIIGLAIFILFYNQAFPTASLNIRVDKKKALKIGEDFIAKKGFDLKGFDKTGIFYSDYYAVSYLQKTQGLKKSNELIRRGLPVWFWRLRWFKELQKEGFIVDIDPASAEVVRFDYFILEDKKGDNLTQRMAMIRAVEEITSQGIDLSSYELKDTKVEKQKNRTDYHFSWEKKDYKVSEATLRLDARIYGDKLGRYRKYLKTPEAFQRYLDGEVSLGQMLTRVATILTFVLVIIAIFTLVFRGFSTKANWKVWLGCGGIIFFLRLGDFFNSLPATWIFYSDVISKKVFFITALGEKISDALSLGIMVFAYGMLGEFFTAKLSLFFAKGKKHYLSLDVILTLLKGYCLGFLCLGYLTLFYLLGGKFFSIWMPLKPEYSNVLGTLLPVLFPFTLALVAAVYEEFSYRLFATSFLRKFISLSWIAVLFPALLWGLGHSVYLVFPIYVRAIELTILGIILGLVFIKYGLKVVIIAHFTVNVILAVMPFLISYNSHFLISGIIVMIIVFILPAPIITFLAKKLNEAKS